MLCYTRKNQTPETDTATSIFPESLSCWNVNAPWPTKGARLFLRNQSGAGTLPSGFYKKLGWPLTEPTEYSCEHDCASSVSVTLVAEDELSSIFRLQMTVLGGLKNYAMLFLPRGTKPCPVAIIQHGGGGTPELCAHFFSDSNYNNMTRRLLKRGIALLSPQLLLWRKGRFGKGYNRVYVDGQLKQLGGSVAALEIYGIQRWIDYLQTRADLDTGALGMTGLSYGGFYTLFATAADPRICAAYSSCFFNSRYRYD